MTTLSDLFEYDEPLPSAWAESIEKIETAGGDRNLVEAQKLRMQIALVTSQANVAIWSEDQANARAKAEADAANARSTASDKFARRLGAATWVLALATIALVLATIVMAVRA